MKVLLDTNILMDALQERQPFDVDAKEILKRGQDKKLICLFTANAATDIFYIYSKAHDVKTARSALRFLLTNYDVVSVTQEDCLNALKLPLNDFEDALAAVCAQKVEADYIVTRDEKFLSEKLSVKVISPKELLSILG
jgi:predicted nucleic acid-binding protein